MAYTIELLNPVWWFGMLFGTFQFFFIIAQLFLLLLIRRIPNMTLFPILNIAAIFIFVIYSWMNDIAPVAVTGILGIIVVVWAIVFFNNHSN